MQETIPSRAIAVVTPRLRTRTNQWVFVALFLLPAAALFLTFVIYPIVQAAYLSMFRWNGLGPLERFIWFDNFVTLFNDEIFRKALLNNFIIAVLSITIQLPMALGFALLIGRKLPGRSFFRAIFFVPYIISEAITAVLWSFIFNPRFGASDFIDSLLDFLLPFFEPGAWLADPDKVLMALFVVLTWKFFGLHMLLFLAGLQQIPTEIEEAASIDGANQLQTLWNITLPMLSRTIFMTIYLSVLGCIQQFDLVWLMTQGDPAYASEVLTTYMYRNGFISFRLGYGSSVALVLFLICLVFSLLFQNVFMRQDYAGLAD